MSETIIPCLDLKQQHKQIRAELFQKFEKVFDSTAFSGGSFVEEFENNFALFCGTQYAIGVNNGTSALQLALLALGIGPGDEVIVPANTFIATAWGVTHAGATPVFVDCMPDTWQIDASKIEQKITRRTKAVIGVHLYGQPCDVAKLNQQCTKHGLLLLEDAAQAQGAKYNGVRVGGFGQMACFSFYPGKNLGACGEAGGITTNSPDYNSRLRSLRNHGSTVRYYHDEVGFNMRMGGLEGASLTVKLKYLEKWNFRRKEIAQLYFSGIKNLKLKMQIQPKWAESVFHLFVITTHDRDDLIKNLNENNIFPALHYPVPCHLQKAYAHLNYKKGDFPCSEYLSEHCLSLPMYPEMENFQVEKVINALNKY